MSGPGSVRGGSGAGGGSASDDDQALVEVLAEEARRLAADDDRGGPSPAAWYRLARARRERAVQTRGRYGRYGGWGGPLPAGAVAALVAGVGCLVVVGIGAFRWRQARHGPEALASDATAASAPAAPVAPGLSFSIQGATVTRGEEIDVVGTSNAELRFSDGTDVGLDVGTRLAVTARDARGARLRLQSGRARFQVVHLPNAAWTVDAGPYLIEVTGTVFAVRWAEADQTIEIAMESGSVRVSGPLLSERTVLRTGQRLLVRATAGDVHIDQLAQDEPTHREPGTTGRGRPRGELALASPGSWARPRAAPPTGTPSAVEGKDRIEPSAVTMEPPPFEAPVPAPADRAEGAGAAAGAGLDSDSPPAGHEAAASGAGRARTGWTSRRWTARVSSGDSQAVLAEAEQIGFEATLAGADGADLAAFADAARYSGRPDLADRALVETRRRYPGGARAQAAAFLLGRAADDRGDTPSGLAWFRRYLTDAPHGPFASEALGRQMMAVEKLRGRTAAAPLAAEYLRRFPNGTYLLRARALLLDR